MKGKVTKLFRKESKREEIIEKMRLPDEIRDLNMDEQKNAMISFINEIFESKILENENYIQDVPNYQYSQRQNVVLENFKKDIDNDLIVDAYNELRDFIHNYGDTTYKKVLLTEVNEIVKDLQLLCDKINNISKQENINKIIDKIIAKIDKLDKGTEIAMSELWKDEIKRYKLEFEDLFDMNEKILDICEEKNIKLNFDKYADAYVGLPYDVPFIKV